MSDKKIKELFHLSIWHIYMIQDILAFYLKNEGRNYPHITSTPKKANTNSEHYALLLKSIQSYKELK